jgi:hypothetical protein
VYNGLSSTDGLGQCWAPQNGPGNFTKLLRGGLGFGGAFGQVPIGSWHHVAVTLDAASNYTLYIDGVNIVAAAGLAFNAIAVTSPFLAGAASFSGQLAYFAHVALYPVALTAARVAAHFAAPAALQIPAQVGVPTSFDLSAELALLNLIYAAVHKVY